MSEIIARDSFNDPDKGVFVAPPGLMSPASTTARRQGRRRHRRGPRPGCGRGRLLAVEGAYVVATDVLDREPTSLKTLAGEGQAVEYATSTSATDEWTALAA